jgi:4-carboxymuconolactone decarboxylase
MPRLSELSLEAMSAEQKRVHGVIASGPRGQVRGPLAVWLRRPELAERAQALGEYCRYNSSLPKRLSELAILVTARYWKAEFEWFAHRQHALEAGLPEDIVEAIRTGRAPSFADPQDQAVYDISTAIYRDRGLSDEVYARGLSVLGEDRLVDLIGVLGYYALISMTINAFEVSPPAGTPAAFSEGGGA